MDVNRKVVKRLKLDEDINDGYVQMDMAELISVMWEITQDAWSFMRDQNAEQRLQRDVAIVTGREKDELDVKVLIKNRGL
jgi:hypothetical protein